MQTETWSAGQIGDSFGAYSGRTVQFIGADDQTFTGVLDKSDGMTGSENTMLVVGGLAHIVPNDTPVVVL
jgi:hypothetical protein